MRFLCIGDSLGLPRDRCPYESTWFYKLREAFPQHEFINFFTRGLVITEAINQYDLYFRYYNPDIVVIQTGVCDCAPRYINVRRISWIILKKICMSLKSEALFWKFVKLKGRSEHCVYTPIDIFQQNFEMLIKKFIEEGSCKKIFVVLIGKSTDDIIEKNKYFNKNVDRYNMVIKSITEKYKDIVTVLDPLGNPCNEIYTDGYHCNEIGMSLVFNDIKRYIE